MSKRICVISNSQGTSLGLTGGVSYPRLLDRLLAPTYEVCPLVISGWSIADVQVHFYDNVIGFNPSLVVLQVGIIECAQRILTPSEKRLLSALPFGRRITRAIYSRRAEVLSWRNRLGASHRRLDVGQFARLTGDVCSVLERHGIPVLLLEIPRIPDGGESLRHPFINADIDEYNAVLAKLGAKAFGRDWPVSDFVPETVHFSAEGHVRAASEIRAHLDDALAPGAMRPAAQDPLRKRLA